MPNRIYTLSLFALISSFVFISCTQSQKLSTALSSASSSSGIPTGPTGPGGTPNPQPTPGPTPNSVCTSNNTVNSLNQLSSAIDAANTNGGNATICLQDGTYTLTTQQQYGFNISANNIAIVGASGNRDNVILQGDAMSSSATIQYIFQVTGSNFSLSNITLQKVAFHLVHLINGTTGDQFINIAFKDGYQQLLKANGQEDPTTLLNTGPSPSNVLVQNCLFEYTAGIGPNYYIGGIDSHGGQNWTVRSNIFKNIISPSGTVAEFAIHFWDISGNNLVERNLILNSDRGIGFGLAGRGNTAGIIRNNMIYHDANIGTFTDVGIYIEDSPNTQVYNNSVYKNDSYNNAIEYCNSPPVASSIALTTHVLIQNNLTNKNIVARDLGSGTPPTGTVNTNVTSALASWFVSVANGNLDLTSAISGVVGAGVSISGLKDDFDGNARPTSGIDIGADQY